MSMAMHYPGLENAISDWGPTKIPAIPCTSATLLIVQKGFLLCQ